MRWGWKTPIAVLAALLLAAGFAACGGDSSSVTTGTSPAASESEPNGEGAASFQPKHHHDSGGGSAQYRVKGGDNSIQDFGSEVEGSEFEKAAAALHDFLDARAAGDWAATCSYLSQGTRGSLESLGGRGQAGGGASCAKVLGRLANPAVASALRAEAAKANVGSLRVGGERAFLIYTGAEKTVLAMPMADEGGAWKVASLAGTPLS